MLNQCIRWKASKKCAAVYKEKKSIICKICGYSAKSKSNTKSHAALGTESNHMWNF